jgi:hypothetical protein
MQNILQGITLCKNVHNFKTVSFFIESENKYLVFFFNSVTKLVDKAREIF